jgi:hypothetical protein
VLARSARIAASFRTEPELDNRRSPLGGWHNEKSDGRGRSRSLRFYTLRERTASRWHRALLANLASTLRTGQ